MTASHSTRSGPLVIAILVILLLIARQDHWFWNDNRLVFGFLPIGLFWHTCISLAAAGVWWLATRIAWPLEDESSMGPGSGEGRSK